MARQRHLQDEGDTDIKASAPEVAKPPMYQVVILNDDYTPMEFVVEILLRFFEMKKMQAVKVMLKVHHEGKGVCGTYTHQIAETKVALVNAYARLQEHPLLCQLERAKD